MRLLGGLRALVIRLKQVVDLKEHVEQDILFMERVVNTLGSIIAGHGEPIFFGSTVQQESLMHYRSSNVRLTIDPRHPRHSYA